MSMNSRKLGSRLDAWLEGTLIVGRTVREGLSTLGDRDSISVHIDELVGRGARLTKRQLLQASLDAFEVLREKFVGDRAPFVLLAIDLINGHFPKRLAVTASSIHRQMGITPPELFIFHRRAEAQLRKWLNSCIRLENGQTLNQNPNTLLAAIPKKTLFYERRVALYKLKCWCWLYVPVRGT